MQSSQIKETSSQNHQVIVVGLDSCDPVLVQRWAREGKLPFLSSLMKTGVWSPLVSAHGLFPDMPWVSCTTGVVPAKHGFFNFMQLKRGTTEFVRRSPSSIRHYPFWWLLRGVGKRVAIFDVPKTYPLANIDGVQVAAWGEHYPLIEQSSLPKELIEDLVAKFGTYRHAKEVVSPRTVKTERHIYDLLRSGIEQRTQAIAYLLKQENWDLFFTVFSESHYAGHQFYHHHDTSHWAHDAEWAAKLDDPLPASYTRLDRALAELFQQRSADVTLILVSVHGIATNYSGNHFMPDILEKLGYQVRAEHPAAPTSTTGQLLKLTASIRNLIPNVAREWINEHLVPEAVHDRAYFGQFSSRIDWRQSKAFFMPSDHFEGFISINLHGREPFGTVQPGAEYDQVCTALISDLKQLTNPDTGRSAVRDVIQVSKLMTGPFLFNLPDLVVQWADDAYITSVHHPRFGILSDEHFDLRKSQHTTDGFLIATGKHINHQASLINATTLDIAPTLLYLMGQPIPNDYDGRVLTELLDPEFVNRTPIQSCDRPLIIPEEMVLSG